MRPEVYAVPTEVTGPSFFFPVWGIHAIVHFLLLHSCSGRCWKEDEEMSIALMVLVDKGLPYMLLLCQIDGVQGLAKQWFPNFLSWILFQACTTKFVCVYAYHLCLCLNSKTRIAQTWKIDEIKIEILVFSLCTQKVASYTPRCAQLCRPLLQRCWGWVWPGGRAECWAGPEWSAEVSGILHDASNSLVLGDALQRQQLTAHLISTWTF